MVGIRNPRKSQSLRDPSKTSAKPEVRLPSVMKRALGVIATVSILLAGAGQPALAHHPDHLACATKERTGKLLVVRNCSHQEDLEQGAEGALEFLEHHAFDLGMPVSSGQGEPATEEANGFVLLDEKHGLGSIRSHFIQILDGLPIYGSETTFNQSSSGDFKSLYLRYHRLAAGNPNPTLSVNEAEVVARSAAQVQETRLPTTSELVWYPRPNGAATLTWKLMVFSAQPLGDFLTLVDAHSGKLLLQENRINFDSGSGYVYWPNPIQTSSNTALVDNNDACSAALEAELLSVTLLGLDSGVGTLKGEFVDLVSLAGGLSVPDADEPTRVYEYDRCDARFEQVTAYHVIDSIQRYFHTLGFDDDTGTPNGIRDFATLAHAHWYEDDQSFYSTGDDALHMGDGGVDDGEDADIIAHEYGHAIQHNQNSCWGGGEMGAMGEAFGDYLAASFFASSGDSVYQNSHAACVGDWDAVSYDSGTPACLRRVDGTKIYPDDLQGAVHADGEIWSAALWAIRSILGATTTDQIVLEHHFTLPCDATMPIAALELIQANTNLNAGANEAVIRQAFCDRGILTGTDCTAPSGLTLAYSVSPSPVLAGETATYTLVATNTSESSLTGVILSATAPAGSNYVTSSASDSGTESGGTVAWPSVDLPAGSFITRTFDVLVNVGPGSSTLFADDMEAGGANWVASHGSGANLDWVLGTDNPHTLKTGIQPQSAKASACAGGNAGIYPCENVDLKTFFTMAEIGGGVGTDGWGWTDPLDGKEYVLSGRSSGTSFIDIGDPANPVYLGNLPTHSVNSDWRDMKVYQNHAYIVSEAASHGMQVFDLTQLRNVASPPATFIETAHYSLFSKAHNIALNTDTGFAYVVGANNACSGGIYMIDLSSPAAPSYAGCYSDDGYTHDVQCVVYSGPDASHSGKEICFASNEDTLTIVDVTNKATPVLLSRTSYAGYSYSHQGWLTDDQRYFLMDDELDEDSNGHPTKTYIWDVSDLEVPTITGSHSSHLSVIDHNLYVIGDFVYQANYEGGLRILKTEDLAIADLCEVASFDTYPSSNESEFNGAWNVYPFFASGIVSINAIEGLAIVQPDLSSVSCAGEPPSSGHAWFASDPNSISDQYLTTAAPVSVAAGTSLSFWHDYKTESSYDGGVAEYSSDGGATWLDLDSQMVTNGYSGTLSSSYNNPIGGRSAFTGDSGGYIQTVANLGALTGQSVDFRLRMATDSSVNSTGWYFDDISIGTEVSLSSTVQSSGGVSETTTLVTTVAPGPTNSDPVLAINAVLSVAEAASAIIDSSVLLVTDADAGETLTYTVVSGPTSGALSPAASFTQADIDANAVSYTHDGSETVSDSFSFSVSDGNGGSLATTTFNITVTPTNDNPVLAINAGLTLVEAAVALIDSSVLQVTDPDAGDTLTYTIVSGPTNGVLSPAASFTQADIDTNAVSYTHDGSETLGDSFSFSVSDGNGGTVGVTTFNITVTPTNDNPVLAVNAVLSVAEAASAIIDSSVLLVTDADAGETLTYTVVSGPTSGVLSPAASFTQAEIDTNAVSYTHDGSETVSDSFSFSVSDGNGGSLATTTFNITVTPTNDNPVLAINAGLTLVEAAVALIDSSVLQVTDPDAGDTLTYTIVSGPTNGVLSPAASFTQAEIDTNAVSYTHDGSETLGDSFSFSVSDGNGGTVGVTTFNITVTPTNDNPVLAVNAVLSVAEAASALIDSSVLLVTDADAGETLTYTVVSGPTSGALSPAASFTQAEIDTNAVSYTHDGSETVSDSFSFSVSDDNGGTVGITTFNITVTPTNDNPVLAINAVLTVAEAASALIDSSVLQVTDPDAGDTLTYTIVSGPTNGVLSPAASFTQAEIDTNAVSYTHDGSETLGDSFSFSVSDGNGGTVGVTTFNLTITPTNDAPELGLTALPPGVINQPYEVNFTPSDADTGDQLTVLIVGGTSWFSSLVEENDGSWTLSCTLTSAELGTNSIVLRVEDDGNPALSHQVTLNLIVTGFPSVPSLGPGGALILLILLGLAAYHTLRRRIA